MTTGLAMDWVLIALLCAATAALAVAALTIGTARPSGWFTEWRQRLSRFSLHHGPSVWLFDGDTLIDSSLPGGSTLPSAGPRSWSGLRQTVSDRFPAFPETQKQVALAEPLRIPAKDPLDPAVITVENFGGILRVELSEGEQAAAPQQRKAWNGGARDSNALAVERNPYPIWRVSQDGKVLWSNPAYVSIVEAIEKSGKEDPQNPFLRIPPDFLKQTKTRRIPVVQNGQDSRHWFDVEIVPDEQGALCYAVNIDAVVDAENAQRNFVQTLAKTFAQLSIGLAIFDRNRQLALFNPALIDLTGLPAEFLSVRPNLLTFFDRLRDKNMMPEPKDYKSWRHQMAELVAAASDGRYHETWTLPSGSVYSISGRPHPDGAIAFLFEDITAEITLTRRFRSDLELGQSVFDQVHDAIVVFASDGSLAMCNAAYRNLWSVDPDSSFVQMTVVDATRSWQSACRPTPAWGEIRDFVATRENRAEWEAEVEMATGVRLDCRISPVHSGATVIIFRTSEEGRPVLPIDTVESLPAR